MDVDYVVPDTNRTKYCKPAERHRCGECKSEFIGLNTTFIIVITFCNGINFFICCIIGSISIALICNCKHKHDDKQAM